MGGAGTNTKYGANVNGAIPISFGQNYLNNGDTPAPPEFGDVSGGTFVGVGTGMFTTDLENNPITTQDGANSPSGKGGTAAVYTNSQTSDYTSVGNIPTPFLLVKTTLGPPISTNMVHSLEVDSVSEDSSGNVLPVPANGGNGPIPFANVVVPASVTTFTVHGALAGDGGGAKSFSTVIGAVQENLLAVKLTGTGNATGGNIGTVTLTGCPTAATLPKPPAPPAPYRRLPISPSQASTPPTISRSSASM